MEVREKIESYGLRALSDKELFALVRYKGEPSDFFDGKLAKICLEIASRKPEPERSKKVLRSAECFSLFDHLKYSDQEQFWCAFLRNNHTVISVCQISTGNATACIVDVQKILRMALERKAQKIIVAHNHPSGELRPSKEDNEQTGKLKNAAKLMDIHLLDHLIITVNGYYSFADEGGI